MLAIFINVLAIIAGGFVGSITKRSLNVKYLNALATGMGIAILVMGINVAMQNMSKSDNPVLFIFCLAAGGLIGTMLNLDGNMERASKKIQSKKSNADGAPSVAEGITTATLLCCVGTLAMMGPILSAIYGDDTYLYTNATLDFVTLVIVASTYGFGSALSSIPVLLWMSFFYFIGWLFKGSISMSPDSLSAQIITETNIVGGVLIAAAGLGVLHIKDCKTVNLLPSLLLPMIYLCIRSLF